MMVILLNPTMITTSYPLQQQPEDSLKTWIYKITLLYNTVVYELKLFLVGVSGAGYKFFTPSASKQRGLLNELLDVRLSSYRL